MIDERLVLAGHDCSDGGLLTTISEMVMAGNCGADIRVDAEPDRFSALFAEEAGLVIEYLPLDEDRIRQILGSASVTWQTLGSTATERRLRVRHNEDVCLDVPTPQLLAWWEAISDRLEQLQTDPDCVREQASSHDRSGRKYHLSFTPEDTPPALLRQHWKTEDRDHSGRRKQWRP